MSEIINRRTIIKAAIVAATLPLTAHTARNAHAAALPLLDTKDPLATAMGYEVDTTKVDKAANPAHKPAQKCATCIQFQGKATDKQGSCNLFPGKNVVGAGWCKVWLQKPGT